MPICGTACIMLATVRAMVEHLALKKLTSFHHVLYYCIARSARGQSHLYRDSATRCLSQSLHRQWQGQGRRAKHIPEEKAETAAGQCDWSTPDTKPCSPVQPGWGRGLAVPPASCTQTRHGTCLSLLAPECRKPGRELLCRQWEEEGWKV